MESIAASVVVAMVTTFAAIKADWWWPYVCIAAAAVFFLTAFGVALWRGRPLGWQFQSPIRRTASFPEIPADVRGETLATPRKPTGDAWLQDAVFYTAHGRWLGEKRKR